LVVEEEADDELDDAAAGWVGVGDGDREGHCFWHFLIF
jgi:hypothetical protein